MNIPPVGVPVATQATSALTAVALTLLDGEAPGLKLGQTLQATVQRVAADRVTLLLADGPGQLIVSPQEEMPAGQALQLRVRAVQPQVVFEAVPAPLTTPPAQP